MAAAANDLARTAAAWLACLAFALVFLISVASGHDGMTPVWRGAFAATSTYVGGLVLARPLVSTVLDAMARDRAQTPEEPAVKPAAVARTRGDA